jgi:dipeptidyl aminopeptidase/acylaminoacyl peptidase
MFRKYLAKLFLIIFAAKLSTAAIAKTQGENMNDNQASENKSESENLIPRKLLFGNPEISNFKISHDGRYVSYVAPYNGVLNIYLASSESPREAKAITEDTGRGISKYVWAYDDKHILYLRDNDGDENWKIYKVNIDSLESTLLTPEEGVQARFENLSHKFPGEALISLNDRNSEYHDLYKLNLHTGERELLFENNQYASLITDDDFRLRFLQEITTDGWGITYQWDSDSETAKKFMEVDPENLTTTEIEGFAEDSNVIYILDSRDRDTNALYKYDLNSGDKRLIFEDDRSDIASVMKHPRSRALEAVSSYYYKSEWYFFDEKVSRIFEKIHSHDPEAEIAIGSRTLDNNKWVVVLSKDNKPTSYNIFDYNTEEIHHVGLTKPDLGEYNLSRMHPVGIKSRDGLNLVSYITIPYKYQKSDHSYLPFKEVPLILVVHGGPEARDAFGINATHQWLANRGYAVLSVNYRGSSGFGKEFLNAGRGQWAEKMHDDLIDAVDWAINNGITSNDKVAIMGGSYGGYATLVGMTMTPDRFACGIDLVGVSNLNTLVNSIPPYWRPIRSHLIHMVGGDPETEEGKKILDKKSPINYVQNIKKPLLIAQGYNDPRVKKNESDQIVEAMKNHNIPVTYLLYPDEGHGFVRPENRLSFFAIAEKFLHKNLGGSYQERYDEFDNSSIQIIEDTEN